MSRGAERAAKEAAKRERVLAIRASEPELTQPQIAERVGVSRKTVAEWLREARRAKEAA